MHQGKVGVEGIQVFRDNILRQFYINKLNALYIYLHNLGEVSKHSSTYAIGRLQNANFANFYVAPPPHTHSIANETVRYSAVGRPVGVPKQSKVSLVPRQLYLYLQIQNIYICVSRSQTPLSVSLEPKQLYLCLQNLNSFICISRTRHLSLCLQNLDSYICISRTRQLCLCLQNLDSYVCVSRTQTALSVYLELDSYVYVS